MTSRFQRADYLSEARRAATVDPSTALRSVEKHSQGRTARTADLSTTLRSGRDDKGEGGASIECGCRTEPLFQHLGWAKAHNFSGRDDKGERRSSASTQRSSENHTLGPRPDWVSDLSWDSQSHTSSPSAPTQGRLFFRSAGNFPGVHTGANMMRARWRGYSVWVLLLAFTASALALDPHRSLDHYGHQAWRTDSGLPQNTVHSILQTRDGFVWLGTDGGLVRFDGVDFVTFDAENTPQFKSDTISDLLEDHSGNLWISTGAGLVNYRGGAFTAYTAARGLPADTVWFSYEDHHQRLWAFTPAGPAWFDGKIFRPLAGAQAAAPLHRQSLAEDARGTLWLGGSSGVFALDT